jgi:hypothetical protein
MDIGLGRFSTFIYQETRNGGASVKKVPVPVVGFRFKITPTVGIRKSIFSFVH